MNLFLIYILTFAYKLGEVACLAAIFTGVVGVILGIISWVDTDYENARNTAKRLCWYAVMASVFCCICPNKKESYIGIGVLAAMEGIEQFENSGIGKTAITYLNSLIEDEKASDDKAKSEDDEKKDESSEKK